MNFEGVMNNENDNLINKIVYLMQTDSSADAPADTVKWAKNIFRTRVAEPRRSLLQKVLAVLQMDLSPDRAVFGERSAAATRVRQLLFSAGENSLDLRITENARNFDLHGQILGAGFADCEIKLEQAEKFFVAKANELSEFGFESILCGTYKMTLTSDEKEIVIENLEIG